jgi:anti-anti-sigma factor
MKGPFVERHSDGRERDAAGKKRKETSLRNATSRETTMVVELANDLVASSAQALRRDILPRIWEGTSRLEIDFRHVKMIDSIGIATLIAASSLLKKTGGTFHLFNVTDEIFLLFRQMRLDRNFEIKAMGR